MVEELPDKKDAEFWKRNFDDYDRRHVNSLEWYVKSIKKAGFKNVEPTYRDGF